MPLRPLAIGEILDGAIRALRSNPRTMVGFSAIAIAIVTLLATAPQALFLNNLLNSPLMDPSRSDEVDASQITDLVGSGGLTVVISLLQKVLVSTVVSALLIVAVDGAIRGRLLRPGQLWTRVRPRLGGVIGLGVLVSVGVILIIVVAMLPGLIVLVLPGAGTAAKVTGVVLMVIGFIVGFIVDAALYLGFWAVAAPVLLLENLSPIAALGRSYRLVRGNFWRVFWIGVLAFVVAMIVSQLLTVPFSLIGTVVSLGFSEQSFTGTLVRLLVTDIGTIMAGAVVYPFAAGVSALLYFDLRMRREGLDVDLIRQ